VFLSFAMLATPETALASYYSALGSVIPWFYEFLPGSWLEITLPGTSETRYTPFFLCIADLIFGLPFLGIALAAGLTGLCLPRPEAPGSAPDDPTPP
jgi:hypothetical protein